MDKITGNIVEVFKTSGKTQAQVADAMGIAQQSFAQYLTGKAFPNLHNLKKLCQALDCTYEEILGELD